MPSRHLTKIEAWQCLVQALRIFYPNAATYQVRVDNYYNDEYTRLQVEEVTVRDAAGAELLPTLPDEEMESARQAYGAYRERIGRDPYYQQKGYAGMEWEEFLAEILRDRLYSVMKDLPIELGDQTYSAHTPPETPPAPAGFVCIPLAEYHTLLDFVKSAGDY